MGQSLFCGTQGAQPGAHLGSMCLGALSTSRRVRTAREKARKVCDGWALTIAPLGVSILPGVAPPRTGSGHSPCYFHSPGSTVAAAAQHPNTLSLLRAAGCAGPRHGQATVLPGVWGLASAGYRSTAVRVRAGSRAGYGRSQYPRDPLGRGCPPWVLPWPGLSKS